MTWHDINWVKIYTIQKTRTCAYNYLYLGCIVMRKKNYFFENGNSLSDKTGLKKIQDINPSIKCHPKDHASLIRTINFFSR